MTNEKTREETHSADRGDDGERAPMARGRNKSKMGAPINPSSKTGMPWRDPPGPEAKLPARWRERADKGAK